MMFAHVNGIRMAYEQRGEEQQTALLLIHGFPLDHRMWVGQLEDLSSRARIIAPDLRGQGRSEIPPGPYTMDQHADDLAALLDHLAIERAIVCGLSMGGYIAFAFWRRHRNRVSALVLADTRPEPDGETARTNRDVAIARVRQAGSAAYAEEMLPRVLAPASLEDERIAAVARRIMSEQPPGGLIGALLGMRDRSDSTFTLSTISVPTLVIVGALDALTPPAIAQKMAATISGAQMAIIPAAGHLSPIENPTAVNEALTVFLDSLRQSE
jgi:3-oxoadipate enol-lactonase